MLTDNEKNELIKLIRKRYKLAQRMKMKRLAPSVQFQRLQPYDKKIKKIFSNQNIIGW